MTRLAVILCATLVSACAVQEPSDLRSAALAEMPVAARLGRTVLTVVYAGGETCDIRAPENLPPGQGWSAAIGGCAGVGSVEVALADIPPEAVILRIADASGPLELSDLPRFGWAEVWVAHPDGYWAQFTAPS